MIDPETNSIVDSLVPNPWPTRPETIRLRGSYDERVRCAPEYAHRQSREVRAKFREWMWMNLLLTIFWGTAVLVIVEVCRLLG